MDEGLPLSNYGWLRLNPMPGKELKGEYVSIIQHPEAEPTQIAVRENEIVDVLPTALRYRTDTQPGSSGSPVFNDSWQVVALHHSAVPDPIAPDTYVSNEGIRISALLAHLAQCGVAHPLLHEMLESAHAEKPWTMDVLRSRICHGSTTGELRRSPPPGPGYTGSRQVAGGVIVTVPVEVFVGTAPAPSQARSPMLLSPTTWAAPKSQRQPDVEKLQFDTDYANRAGYDPDFLGLRIDLPEFTPGVDADLVRLAKGDAWLPYHHFSVAMNHARKLRHVVATNVDYGPRRRLDMARKDFGTDQWIAEPRIASDAQTTARDHVYSDPNIDFGHVNRREDNCWGDDLQEVIAANSDTFHFTNCTPQHKAFNRSHLKGVWGGLENQISLQAKAAYPRLSIFAGPVLDQSDGPIGQVPAHYKVPRRFWKVVAAMADAGNAIRAYGFILDQRAAFEQAVEEFNPGAFKAYLVPLKHTESVTGVRFPQTLRDADIQARGGHVELLNPEWASEMATLAPAAARGDLYADQILSKMKEGRQMQQSFGKFPSLSAFLESYRQAEKREYVGGIEGLTVPEQVEKLKKTRDVVEVVARLVVREPDDQDHAGGLHYRLRIKITEILHSDPQVAQDLQQARVKEEPVFCAIRHGDSMGIGVTVEGLVGNAQLHLKGEWITSEKALAHGGEKMAVLHFTHHPLGFTCTPVKCYS